MKQILSKVDFYILQLLEYLFENPKATFLSLSQFLNIDKRTIKIYVDMANSKYFPIKIVSNKLSLELVIPQNYSIRYIYSATLQNSIEFQIIERCFFEKKISYTKLEEFLFISNSTLKRKIAKINSVLSKKNFMIDLKNLRFVGEENAIEYFFIHYIFDAYLLKKNAFKKNEYTLIQKAITLYSNKQKIPLTEPDLDKATVIVLVMFYQKKNKVLKYNGAKNPLSYDALLDNQIKRLFFPNFPLLNIFSVLKDLQESSIFNTYSQLLQETKKNAILNETKENFISIIHDVSSSFSIPIPENYEKIILDLCTVHNLDHGQPFILYDKHRLFIKQMKQNYSELILFLINKFYFYFKKIEEYQINTFSYILITHWIELTSFIEQNKTKIKIALIYDTDIEHISMLSNDIRLHLHNHCDINEHAMRTLNKPQSVLTHYDLVITNIPGIEIKDTRVLCFPIYPSLSDWIELGVIYQNIQMIM